MSSVGGASGRVERCYPAKCYCRAGSRGPDPASCQQAVLQSWDLPTWQGLISPISAYFPFH